LPFKVIQGQQFWYQSKAHVNFLANVNFLRRYRTRTSKYQKENLLRLTNETIATQVLRISLEFMDLLPNFHLAVIEYLYRGHRAVTMQTFTNRHSNRKLLVVIALSTTFTQCVPETTKFGKITLNKGHFANQGYSRSPILVPIETSYTASY